MTEPSISGTNIGNKSINIDKELLQVAQDKKIKLNIFESGLVITEDTQELLNIFDKDKNGVLEENEVRAFQTALLDAAKTDGNTKLSLDEFEKLIKDKKYLNQLKTLLARTLSGKPQNTTTETLADGTVVTTVSKMNKDGSGKIIKTSVKDGKTISTTTSKYAKGGILKSVIKETPESKIETNFEYNRQKKLTKTVSVTSDRSGKTISTNTKNYEYDKQGRQIATHSVTHASNGECTAKTDTTFKYNEKGKLAETSICGTNKINGPFETVTQYAEDGKTIIHQDRAYNRRGAKYKEVYDGANLNNRAGYLPSERIIYEADGVTIKKRIINEFDEKGLFIGQKEYDKDGKLIVEHTFSKEPDGKFETAYQMGRGDCYLMATINSLNQSEAGKKILSELIQGDGHGNYTVKFKGAELARKSLIDGTGSVDIGKLPANKVHIKGSYTISAAELEAALLQAGKKYSAGDIDFLILELAYEKYRKDVAKTIQDNKLDPRKTTMIAGLDMGGFENDKDDYLSGGFAEATTFIITGKKAENWRRKQDKNTPVCYIDSNYNMHISAGNSLESITETSEKAIPVSVNGNGYNGDIDKLLRQIQEDYKDGKLDNYAVSASFLVSSQEINGEILGKGGHAFAVLGVTEDKIILSNPWSPNTHIEMSIEDFKKAATRLSCTKIADTPYTQQTQQAQQTQTGGASQTHPANQPTHSNYSNTVVTQDVNTVTSTPQAGKKYKIPKGKGYTLLIKEALQAQNIEPKQENIKKAKAQFEQENPGAVKIYNGNKQEWKGNKYLIADTIVKIPKFNID